MITIEELYQIYEVEQHGYALESYKGKITEECESEELKELWNNAVEALQNLTAFFENKVESGELEFFEY
jgi:hypothetical protein